MCSVGGDKSYIRNTGKSINRPKTGSQWKVGQAAEDVSIHMLFMRNPPSIISWSIEPFIGCFIFGSAHAIMSLDIDHVD